MSHLPTISDTRAPVILGTSSSSSKAACVCIAALIILALVLSSAAARAQDVDAGQPIFAALPHRQTLPGNVEKPRSGCRPLIASATLGGQ
jgi:hypothetical protein